MWGVGWGGGRGGVGIIWRITLYKYFIIIMNCLVADVTGNMIDSSSVSILTDIRNESPEKLRLTVPTFVIAATRSSDCVRPTVCDP